MPARERRLPLLYFEQRARCSAVCLFCFFFLVPLCFLLKTGNWRRASPCSPMPKFPSSPNLQLLCTPKKREILIYLFSLISI